MPVILTEMADQDTKHTTSVSNAFGVVGVPMIVCLRTAYLERRTTPDPDGWSDVGDWDEMEECGDDITMTPDEAEKLAAALVEYAAKARKNNEAQVG